MVVQVVLPFSIKRIQAMVVKFFLLCSIYAAIVSSVSANAAYMCPPGGEDPIEVAVGGKTTCVDLMQQENSTLSTCT